MSSSAHRLDVAVLVYNLDITGGMERQARALAERLAARGARVRVVTSFWVDGVLPRWPRGQRALERRGRLSIARVALPRGWGYLGGLEFFELAAAALLAARPPRVLYAVQWTSGVHAVRIGRLLGRPVAVKLACGGSTGDLLAIRSAEDPHAEATLRRVDRVVCLTPQIESEALAAGYTPEQLVRIPNGVDLEPFERAQPAHLPGLEESERVLFVGAFRAQKHLSSLLRAIARLSSERPRLVLLLAGEGEQGPALRELARELGIEGRVRFLGRRDDVPGLLKQAHVFALLSEAEGLSNALLEALAAGVPVVASDIEGNRAVVVSERDGLLVPVDDVPAIAAAIGKVLADRELAARLAAGARERARSFSLEAVAASYERELGSLARRSSPAGSIVARYFLEFENPGILRLLLRALAYADGRLRPYLDRATIAAKHALGLAPEAAP